MKCARPLTSCSVLYVPISSIWRETGCNNWAFQDPFRRCLMPLLACLKILLLATGGKCGPILLSERCLPLRQSETSIILQISVVMLSDLFQKPSIGAISIYLWKWLPENIKSWVMHLAEDIAGAENVILRTFRHRALTEALDERALMHYISSACNIDARCSRYRMFGWLWRSNEQWAHCIYLIQVKWEIEQLRTIGLYVRAFWYDREVHCEVLNESQVPVLNGSLWSLVWRWYVSC